MGIVCMMALVYVLIYCMDYIPDTYPERATKKCPKYIRYRICCRVEIQYTYNKVNIKTRRFMYLENCLGSWTVE